MALETPRPIWNPDAPKEWNEQCNALRALQNEVIAKALKVMGDRDGIFWHYDRVNEMVDRLKKAYSTPERYSAWHVLISSSPEYPRNELGDFAEPNSVVGFYRGLMEKLLKM